jgi:hypothetical protein
MRSCDAPVTVRETHISWVFVAGDRAFKLKKPVVLDFVDYGTPARRQAMCQEEVRRLEGEPTARDLTSSGDATLPRRGPQRRPQSTSAA